MSLANINAIDLNLLRVFDALLEEQSVTRAGARLGLSQSAVSHSLNRLRSLIGDELFIRSPRGVRPTTRALEMGPDVHAALVQLQSVLTAKSFDPALTERRFTLMAAAYTNALITPQLVARMAHEAPRAELVIAEGDPDILEQLDSHRVDFVIGAVEAVPDRVQNTILLRDTLTWVVRFGHPLTQGVVTLDRLVGTPHVAIRRRRPDTEELGRSAIVMRGSWEDLGAFENELRAKGLKRHVGVTVPDTYSALAVVRRSDMAALIPARLAHFSAQSGFIAMIQPPYSSPTVELNLLSLSERMNEPAMKWLFDLITEIAAAI
jgi:DNA-binding transcriptional LysR family regulator